MRIILCIKNAATPIIGVILLILISGILAVTSLTFYEDFNENTQGLITSSELSTNIQVDVLSVSRNQVYLRNKEALNVTRVTLEGVECEGNLGVTTPNAFNVNLSSCSSNLSTIEPTLRIETTEFLIEKRIRIVDDQTATSSSDDSTSGFDCSSLPGNWTSVPGSSYFSTSNFCVMQFEAKDVGGVATSQPSLTPWDNINFTDSRTECSQLNTEHSSFDGTFRIITNREWMTIARDVEQQDTNWNSSTKGVGSMFRGHSDGSPFSTLAVSNTGNYYDGTGNSAPSIEQRVLELSNGEVVWDLGGNVQEWVDILENGSTFNGNACSGSDSWYSYFGNDGYSECTFNAPFSKDSAADTRYEMGPLGDYNADNGIGRVYSDSANGRALLRGGIWFDTNLAGAFTAYMLYDPSVANTGVGFRCSYEP